MNMILSERFISGIYLKEVLDGVYSGVVYKIFSFNIVCNSHLTKSKWPLME